MNNKRIPRLKEKNHITDNKMSRMNQRNQKKNNAKWAHPLKLTKEEFPSLSSGEVSAQPIETINWKKGPGEKQHTKVYPNGDYFDGDLDETGSPSYGTMTFANGNVYEGPFHTSWPKDTNEGDVDHEDEEYEEYDENGEYYEDEEYDEFHDYESYRNDYGVLTEPNGKSFVGLFCWGKGW